MRAMEEGTQPRAASRHTGLNKVSVFASKWEARTRAVEKAHFLRCRCFRLYHLCLGGIAITLSSLLSVMTTVKPEILGAAYKPTEAFLAILAPVFTGLVAFL